VGIGRSYHVVTLYVSTLYHVFHIPYTIHISMENGIKSVLKIKSCRS